MEAAADLSGTGSPEPLRGLRRRRRAGRIAAVLTALLLGPVTGNLHAGRFKSASFTDINGNYGQAGINYSQSANFKNSGVSEEAGSSNVNSTSYSGRSGTQGRRPIPARINDLAVVGVSSYRVTLEWTAPAGDWDVYLSTEDVTRYILRYSTNEILTYADFQNATNYFQTWIPQQHGSTETYAVYGLDAGTTYYFVMESQNQHALRSERSVGVSTITLSPLNWPVNPVILAVYQSSITVSWGGVDPDSGYVVEASTADDFTGVIYSSYTPNVNLTTLTVGAAIALEPNTTYYLRAGALWPGGTAYALTTPVSTATLTSPVQDPQIYAVFMTSVTLNWVPHAEYGAFKYIVEASTSNFISGDEVKSSATLNIALSTLTVSGLSSGATYYFRIKSLNWNNLPTYAWVGSTITYGWRSVWNSSEVTETGSVAWGDFDNDGDLDLAAGNEVSNNQIYRNDGNGTFNFVWNDGQPDMTLSLAWGDFDNDGDLDLATGNDGSNKVYRNEGDGDFNIIWNSAETEKTQSVAWGDFDNDGWLDIAAGNSSGGQTNRIYRNNGDETFASIWNSNETENTYSLAWADFDNDGDLDLAAGNNITANTIYKNNGNSTFELIWSDGNTEKTYSLVWGDFDNDGYLDLASGNWGETNRVYKGSGDGTFTSVWNSVETEKTTSLAWADFDNDGDLDLAAGNNAQANQVYVNNGANFELVWTSPDTQATRSLEWGDYDSDGRLDLAAGNFNQTNRIYRGFLQSENSRPSAPGGLLAKFDYEISRSTITFKWDAGDYDSNGSTESVYYAIAAATVPMQLSGDDLRIVIPSSSTGASFVLTWTQGSPPLFGHYLRPAYKKWNDDALARHGVFISTRPNAGEILMNTTYYFRVRSIDAGLRRSTWSPESAMPATPAVPVEAISAYEVFFTSVSVRWDALPPSPQHESAEGYLLQASTAPDFTGTLHSSVTYNISMSTLTVGGIVSLKLNTTYYFRVASLNWNDLPNFAPQISTSTLANPPISVVSTFTAVYLSSMSVAWGHNGNPVGITTYTVVLTTGSSYPNSFGGNASTQTAPGPSPLATLDGLEPDTTYYLFVQGINHNNVGSGFVLLGSTSTLAEPPSDVLITEVFLSSMTLSWSTVTSQGYLAQASSTNFNGSGLIYSSSTMSVNLSTLSVDGLDPNTTYYVRVGAYNWNLVPNYAFGGSSSTLSNPVAGAQFAGIFITSVTVTWIALPPSPPAASSATAEGYVLEASTEPGFVTISESSSTADVNLSTLTVFGLKGSVTYYFRVGSLNWVSVPNFVFVGSATTIAPEPIDPLIAEVHLSSITVVWGGVNPDYGYVLETSTEAFPNNYAGNKSSSTPDSSLLTLTVKGLSRNTTYYLRVGAVWTGTTNYALTSPVSTATLANQPDWASPLFLEVWTSSISAQWTSGAPANPAGTLYVLEASSTSFIPGTLLITSNTISTSAFATLLLPDTTYSFRVRAINHNSVPSPYLSIGSTSTLAEPPSDVLITEIFLSSMTLSWSTVTSQGYLAQVSSTGFTGGTVYSSSTLAGDLSSLTVSSLDSNTTYYVRVGAYNWNSVANYAFGGSSVTLSNPVTGVQFADIFITSVTVTWIALPPSPPVTSSATARGYVLEASTAPNFTGTIHSSITYNVSMSTLTVGISLPLSVNTTYYFRVASLNWNNAPNFAPAVSTATLASQPGEALPLFLEVWTSSISARWTSGALANPDGTLYVLEASSTSFTPGTTLITSNTISTSAFAMSLLPNTTYSFRVRAINHDQVPSPYLTIGSTSTLAEPPLDVLIAEVFLSSMTVSWSTVSSNGYIVETSTASNFTGTIRSSSTQNPQIATLTVPNLSANTTYYIRVGAYNWNGLPAYAFGGSSSTLTEQVTGTQFANVFFTSVTVSWTPRPPAPPEVTAEGYLLEASTAPNFTGTVHSSVTYDSSLGILTVGISDPLELNTTYYFRVASLNWSDAPNFAPAVSTSTLANPPLQVVPTFTAVYTTSMTVAWDHNSNPVGITTYTVVLTTGSFYPNSFGGNVSTRTAPVSPLATFTGLDSNTTYYFFAEGVNHNNVGSGFALLGSTSTLAWPVTGTLVYAVFTTSVTINWNAMGPGGASGYVLQASTSATFAPVWSSSFTAGVDLSTLTAAGLLSGATYWFRVGALNWNNVPTFANAVSTRTYGWGSIWASSELENTLSLSIGDFDNDGDLDIAAGNSAQTNRIYRNNGDLTFSAVWNSSQEWNTRSIAWGDFDNDGDLDIAAGNDSQISYVYQNDGSGGFISVWATSVGEYTKSLVWGDFDNDGLLDLAAGNAGDPNQIYRNNGDGSFQLLWSSIEAENTYAVACGDFDNDGDLDIMVGNNSQTNHIYRNNGNGSFESVWNSQEEDDTNSLAWADFDNDGDLDIAVGNDGTNRVYRNNGNGTFSSVWNGADENTWSLAWADYDNDGRTDLVIGNYNAKNKVYRNNGNETFTLIWESAESENTAAAAWADFGGDGKLDIASVNNGQANRVYSSVLMGTNQPPSSPAGLAAWFEYGAVSSTITFKWDAAVYDAGLSSASVYYAIAAATAPMTLSGDSLRIVYPSSATVSSFTLTWTDGSPLLGHYLRPAYKKWNVDVSSKHGVFISSTPNAGAVLMNTTYYFRVRSIDSGLMQSAWSVESALLTLALPVSEARIYEVFPQSATVNWTPLLVSPSWASAQGYILEASTAPDFTGTLHSSSTRNVSLSTLTVGISLSLSVNTTYYFRIASLNWRDEPNYTLTFATSTLVYQPAPAVPVFTRVQTSTISLAWAHNGNPANVTDYDIVLTTGITYPNNFGGNISISTTPQGADPAAELTGLSPDTTYFLFVQGVNHNNVGSGFAAFGSTSTLALPPSNVLITEVFLSSMTLSWSTVTSQGYLAQVSSTGFTGGIVYSSSTLADDISSLTVSSLDPNTTYYVRVGAYNWNSVLNYALGGSSSTLANPVTGVQLAGVFVSSVAVTWNSLPQSPPAASSETAEGYRVDASTEPGFVTISGSSATADVNLSTLTVLSLKGGVTYYFRVGSLNWQSVANYVFVGSATTAAPKPVNPLISKVYISSIAVSWGGVDPDYGYVLEASTGAFPNNYAGNKSSSTPDSSFLALTVEDLTPNTTYFLRAGSVWTFTTNYALTTPASTSTLANQPGAALPPFLEVWLSSISAQWTKGTPQNPDATPYVMEASSTSFTPGTLITANTISTSAFAASLLPNTTYSFRVKAINHNQLPSPYLDIGSTSTLAVPPSDVIITEVFLSSMTLSWSTATASSGYLAQVSSTNFNGSGLIYSSSTLAQDLPSLSVEGLDANTTYYVRVGAYNWNLVPNYAFGGSSSTLANPVTGAQFAGVFMSSVTVTWTPLPQSPPAASSATALGYVLETSTEPGFVTISASSSTADINLSTLTVSSLESGTTYYFRIGSLNWQSVPNYSFTISTRTIWMGPQNPVISAVFQSSITAVWGGINPDGGYVLEASTEPFPNEFAGNESSATLDSSLLTLTVENLSLNTTYYLRAGAVWAGTTNYALTTPASTSTLTNQPGGASPPFLEVWLSSISAQWTSGAPANPDGTLYVLETSSDSFTPGTLITSNTISTSAFAKNLLPDTTYSFRVRAINHNSVPSPYRTIGSTSTLAAPPSDVIITEVFLSSMTLSWSTVTSQGYLAQVSSTGFTGGTVYSSSTLAGDISSLTVSSLDANTTYYVRVGAYNWNLMPNFALGGSSSTLANPVTGVGFAGVFVSSIAVAWTPLPESPPAASSATAEGYVLEASTGTFPNAYEGNKSSSTTDVNLSTLTITGISPGVTYYFRIGSLNWNNAPNFAAVISTRTMPAPVNPVISTVYLSSIAVDWTGVNPDNGYVVEASTGQFPNEFAGNESSSTLDSSILTLTVISLSRNTTYYLRVGALWPDATIYAPTTPVSTATLANQPGTIAPAFLEVWTSSISAQWTSGAPANPDGTLYILEASSTSFTPGTVLIDSNTQITSAFVMNLLPDTTYSFRVKAINHNQLPSAYQDIGSTSTLALPPSNILITDVFLSSMTLSWDASTSQGYLAQVSSTNFTGGIIRSSSTPDSSLLALAVDGLDANTTYYVRVGAYNWNGVPNFASGGSSSTLSNPVAWAQFAGVFASSVSVTWIPLPPSPPVTSSATAEGYVLEASTGTFPNAYEGNKSSSTTDVNLSTLTITGLSTGVTYYFRIGSLNWASVGNFLFVGSTRTIAPEPGDPVISAVYLSSIAVTWTGTTPDADGYVVEASTSENFATFIASVTDSALALTVESLTPNTTYYLRTGAIWSGATSYALTTVSTATLASQPGGASPPFLEVWTSSISAQWTSGALANPDGTLYILEASSTSFIPGTVIASNTQSTSAFAMTLLPDTTYSFRVRAVNHNQLPSADQIIGSTSTLALPPSNVLITEVFLSSMTISWSASTCQGYRLEVSPTNFSGGTILSSSTSDSALLTLTVKSLDANTTYYVRVGAYNWNSVPNYASGGSSSTLTNLVTGAFVQEVFPAQVTLTWNPLPPSPPQSASAEGYLVEASTEPGFATITAWASTADVNLSTLTVSGLEGRTTYYFRVGSLNWANVANYVFIGSTRTLAPAPINPVISAVYLSSITVNWTGLAPSPDGYVVEASTDFSGGIVHSSYTADVNLSTLTVLSPELSPNTIYFLRVGALWQETTSYAYTTPVSTVTLASPPASAVSTFTIVGSTFMTVAWMHNGNPVNVTTYTVVLTTGPSYPNTFQDNVTLSTVPQGSFPAAKLTGLESDTTYYLFIEAVNLSGIGSGFVALGSTKTHVPEIGITGFKAVISAWKEVTLTWNDLTPSEKSKLPGTFESYKVRRSTYLYDYRMLLGELLAETTVPYYVDGGLTIGVTYYYQASIMTTALEFGETELEPVPVLGVPSKPPFGINLIIQPQFVRINWLPPAAYANDVAFANALEPAYPGEVLAYHIYRATAPRGAPWTFIVKHSTDEFHSDLDLNDAYYYHVKAVNQAGLSMTSMIRSVASGAAYIVADDGWSMLEIPKEYLSSFVFEGSNPASIYALSVSSHPEDLGGLDGRVLKSLEFSALKGGLTPESMKLPGMAYLHLHYEKPGTLIVPSAVTPTPENISVYWHNGTKYVQLYGRLDLAYQEIVIRTSMLGRYQIRSVERVGGWAADRAGLSNRFITPNGDGKNDRMVFVYDNPRDSAVTGKIYDLKGAFVADMTHPQGFVENSLEWDAKSGGQVVPGGVYIYQIEGEGKLYNGTIVVIR